MAREAKKVRKIKELGPLQDLLLRCCPPDEKGRTSISILAKAIGMSNYGVYLWIKHEYVPQKRIQQLVKLSGGKVKLNDFMPFFFQKKD